MIRARSRSPFSQPCLRRQWGDTFPEDTYAATMPLRRSKFAGRIHAASLDAAAVLPRLDGAADRGGAGRLLTMQDGVGDVGPTIIARPTSGLPQAGTASATKRTAPRVAARRTPETMAFSDADTMLAAMPTPNSVSESPTRSSK